MVSRIIIATLLVACTGQAVRFPQDKAVVQAVVRAGDEAIAISPELDPQTYRTKELRLQMLRGRRLSNRHSHGPGHRHVTSERENMVEPVLSGDLCGDGSPYCSSPLHYPQEMIDRAMKKSSAMKWIPPLFDPPPPLARNARPSFRSGLLDEFENVCQSSKTTIAPRVGTNSKNQQRYLVNGGVDLAEFDSLVRTINIVSCLGSQEQGVREECSGVRGRRSECRQEYTEHKMVALDQEKGELVVETFSFPSCCSCMLHVPWGR